MYLIEFLMCLIRWSSLKRHHLTLNEVYKKLDLKSYIEYDYLHFTDSINYTCVSRSRVTPLKQIVGVMSNILVLIADTPGHKMSCL